MSASTGANSLHEIHQRIPADAGQLAEMRHALGRWAAGIGMPGEKREELVLAAYEAMANSVEHAYARSAGDPGSGEVELHAARTVDGSVVVTVSDHGTWKPPEESDGIRGRGIPLMQALADDTTITSVDAGTTVTMTWKSPMAPR
ncbi:MAG TPA: ATP-binding protein [Actinophytocola sp.]|jgi:anti-sigma regulatory factor (Ser/Thr protein kinase)|nr:ATP-binding protein [Actinophytocola sp.]